MAEWQAYYNIEPFGSRHRDIGLGIIGATIANFAPFRKKAAKPFSADQFMIKTAIDRHIEEEKKKKKMSPAAIKEFFVELRNSMRKKG